MSDWTKVKDFCSRGIFTSEYVGYGTTFSDAGLFRRLKTGTLTNQPTGAGNRPTQETNDEQS
jgi:hypothetical protein